MSKISIALCTYNGSKYLKDQLKSICLQSRLPDEMIVCDDRSSDHTVDILNKFSKSAPFPCKIFLNKTNLKPTKNFEKAIRLCTGDYIALSDQDDSWHPDKLRYCEILLHGHKDIGAVFTNAEVVDSAMNRLGYTTWERFNFNAKEQVKIKTGGSLSVLLKHYVVTGSTLMFRATFRPVLLPIPHVWFHDAWIALLIASVSSLSFVPHPLVNYRQHFENHLGGIRKSLVRQIKEARSVNRLDFYQLELDRYRSLYHRVSTVDFHNQASALRLINEKIDHLEKRSSLPCNRLLRIPKVSKELLTLGYRRYARNWGSVAMDAFIK